MRAFAIRWTRRFLTWLDKTTFYCDPDASRTIDRQQVIIDSLTEELARFKKGSS